MSIGPVQLLVFGFEGDQFRGEIRAELARLRSSDTLRLLDLLFVRKHTDGLLETLFISDAPPELQGLGTLLSGLIGADLADDDAASEDVEEEALPDDLDVWFADDAIPAGTAAAIALIEHRWAVPLYEAIERAGGEQLSDAWIHRADLEAIGLITGAPIGGV